MFWAHTYIHGLCGGRDTPCNIHRTLSLTLSRIHVVAAPVVLVSRGLYNTDHLLPCLPLSLRGFLASMSWTRTGYVNDRVGIARNIYMSCWYCTSRALPMYFSCCKYTMAQPCGHLLPESNTSIPFCFLKITAASTRVCDFVLENIAACLCTRTNRLCGLQVTLRYMCTTCAPAPTPSQGHQTMPPSQNAAQRPR